MSSPRSRRNDKAASPCFERTLKRLEESRKQEANVRLLLLSLFLVLLMVMCLVLLRAPFPSARDFDRKGDSSTSVVSITLFGVAILRIWPEIRRCRPRIAELQNAAHRIHYLAERHQIGIAVSDKEWQQVFEAAGKVLNASGHIVEEESLHPMMEFLGRFLLLSGKRPFGQATSTASPAVTAELGTSR